MFGNCFFSHLLFPVFYNSGFTGTLCGGAWKSLTGSANAFNNIGSSTARHGCCSPGQFLASSTSTSTSTVCDACPSGQYGSTVDDDITSCNDCGTGKYGELDGQNSSSACHDCGIGKYGPQNGQSSPNDCKICGMGKYGNQSGLSFCHDCDAGKTTLNNNSITASDCKTGQEFADSSTSTSITLDDASAEQLREAYLELTQC